MTAGGIVAVDDSVTGCADEDANVDGCEAAGVNKDADMDGCVEDGCVTAGEDDGPDVDGCVVGGEVRAEVVAGTKVIIFKLKNIRISYIINCIWKENLQVKHYTTGLF